jgi:4-hydroxy-tetrahydrodipicolinate synthase
MHNNPATSGVDIGPELLVRMFDTVDNVTMVKESTGDLSGTKRIEVLSERSASLLHRRQSRVLDTLHAGAVGRCTAARCLRTRPAST